MQFEAGAVKRTVLGDKIFRALQVVHVVDGSASDKVGRLGGVADSAQQSRCECVGVNFRAELHDPTSLDGVTDLDLWIGTGKFLFYELKRRPGSHFFPSRPPRPVGNRRRLRFFPEDLRGCANSNESAKNERRGASAKVNHLVTSPCEDAVSCRARIRETC